MHRLLCCLGLLLALAWPAGAEDDLLARVIAAHQALKQGQIDARVEVVGDVDFKGPQVCHLWFDRPKLLAWRSEADLPQGRQVAQLVADGEKLWLFNSSENGYLSRVFSKDVVDLARPESGLSLGPHSVVLKLMLGEREYLLNGRTLRIPKPTPDAQGECMFELVGADGDVDQFYVDPKSYLLTRLVGLVEGQPMARGSLSYKTGQPDAAVFKFVPPSGAVPVKAGAEK